MLAPRLFLKTRVLVTAESFLHCRILTQLIKLSTRWLFPERLPGWHPWSALRKGTPGGFSERWPECFPRWPSGEAFRKARRRSSRAASRKFRRGMQNKPLFGDVAPLLSRFPPTHASRCRRLLSPRPFWLNCSAGWSRSSCAPCAVSCAGDGQAPAQQTHFVASALKACVDLETCGTGDGIDERGMV